MKSTKIITLTNVAYPNIAPIRNEQHPVGIARLCASNADHEKPAMLTHGWRLVGLLAAGSFAWAPLTLAHGNSGGHTSGMGGHESGQHHDHCLYSYPYSGLSFDYHAGNYDSTYSYRPTPEQQAVAKQQVDGYLIGVRKNRKHAATHRYISVETLRPTRSQFDDFIRRQPPTRHVEPAQLRCLMVFDTQTREFVGSGCYVISAAPLAGEVAQFETVSAEFVGHSKL